MKHILFGSARSLLATASIAAVLAASTSFGAAAPSSDLLEKGIYAEETKGDIDGAMAIYQQLLAEAKQGQATAAQAQFRLGQCLLKKGRAEEAQAAFEKLIRDYPGEKDLVAKASALVPAGLELQPIPWESGERLQLTLYTATGVDIGTTVYWADRLTENGREIWRVGSRLFAGMNSASTVEVDAATFRPISSRWYHAMLGEALASYSATEVRVKHASKPEPTTTSIEGAVYDNEQAMFVMRRLPLAVGYKGVVNILSSLGGGMRIPVGVDVPTKEKITVPAGTFDCFRVNLSVSQTFWFADTPARTLVQFEGGAVVAKLSSVRVQKPGAATSFDDAKLGVSFQAPAGWVTHVRESGESSDETSIYLLDPTADVEGAFVRLVTTEKIPAGNRQTARAWAEASFPEISRGFKDAKIRPDSWKPLVVSGRPAISYVADYMDKDRPMCVYAVHALGTTRSEKFMLMAAANKLDAVKAAFDSIVTSYRAK